MADKILNYNAPLAQEENEIEVKIGNGHLGEINLLFGSISPDEEPEDENPEWRTKLPNASGIRGKKLKLLITIYQFEELEASIFIRINGERILPQGDDPEFPISDNQVINVKNIITFS